MEHCRLRAKIRTPCTAVGVYASRLGRLQCAADALRRTARFIVLARRLESQMTELTRLSIDAPSGTTINGKHAGAQKDSGVRKTMTDRRPSEDLLNLGSESEKERAIAKAALTVAELGTYSSATED